MACVQAKFDGDEDAPDFGSGLWWPRPQVDWIFYRTGTPEWEAMVIGHEVAHMLLGHQPQAIGVLRRSAYAADVERDAEIFGTVLLRQSAAYCTTELQAGQDADPDLLLRIRTAMG